MDQKEAEELYAKLTESIPEEALTVESSRGFDLTSIKAAFVIERLNQVFGLLGLGWRYAYGPAHAEGAKGEVLVEVALQWRVAVAPSGDYCPPFDWVQDQGWMPRSNSPAVWSEPIFATGGSATANRKGPVPWTDAAKSAVTNGLSKAASRLGVGLDVFKGECDLQAEPNEKPGRQPAPRGKGRSKGSGENSSRSIKTLDVARAATGQAYEKLRDVSPENTTTDRLRGALQGAMTKAGLKMEPVQLVKLLRGVDGRTVRDVMAITNVVPRLSVECVELLNNEAARQG